MLPASGARGQQGPALVEVERFASLPVDVRQPEGLDTDPVSGKVFVGTFDAKMPATARKNRVLRFDRDGRLEASRSFDATPLTGIAFREGKLYLLNFGAAKLQRLPEDFEAKTAIEEIASFASLDPPAPTAREVENPDGSHDRILFGSRGVPGINGLVFDRAGDLYVSDSFQGAIYRIADATHCKPCKVEVVSRDPLLGTTNAALPFGANGVAFDDRERYLYITNAGDGRLLRMQMPSGPVSVVAESLPGADGLLHHDGMFWVAANQADFVAGVDEKGRTRVRAGSFVGIGVDGAPVGLLFPASTAVDGDWMIVTNLSLPLTPAEGDEWEEQVTRWTLSRIRIPRDPAP
jgi:sugar lactone lactonase YvrE